jgi:hypothetical protein
MKPTNQITQQELKQPLFGFLRRAILGEWVKYSMHLNLQDEVTRSGLVSLIFEIAGNLDYSYSDYDFLLGEGRQLIQPSMINGDC